MPDNWAFVAAAYALTAVVLGLYWRHLVRKEREVEHAAAAKAKIDDVRGGSGRNVAGTTGAAHMERARHSSTSDRANAERSRRPSSSAHPRPDPTTRGPLQ